MRVAKCFPTPPKGDVPYALCRDETKDITFGEFVTIIKGTRAWQEVMGTLFEELEAERPPRGPKRSYSPEELEGGFLYWLMTGEEFWEGARRLLELRWSARDRDALGFTFARRRYGSPKLHIKNDRRLPSKSTMRRHLASVGLDRQRLHARLVADAFEEFPEEMRGPPARSTSTAP